MSADNSSPTVLISQLAHHYRRGVTVLNGIDLTIEPGDKVALIGRSGAGKSTLLRCVNGLVTPSDGSVQVFGLDIARLAESRRRRVRRRIGMIFQEFNLVDRLTVLKNVLVGRLGYVNALASCFHLFPATDIALAKDCIAQVGLAGYEYTRVRDLSGGQKQRVAIARTIAQGAEIVLGDEATANLDVSTTEDIMEILSGLADKKRVSLLLSMHNVDVARQYCDRIIGLRHGKIVFDARPDTLDDTLVREIMAE